MKQQINTYSIDKEGKYTFSNTLIEAYLIESHQTIIDAIQDIVKDNYDNIKSNEPKDYTKYVCNAKLAYIDTKHTENNIDYYVEANNGYNISVLHRLPIDRIDRLNSIINDKIVEALSKVITWSDIKYQLPHKEDAHKFLEACMHLFPNMNAWKVDQAATSFARTLQNVWHNIDNNMCHGTQACFWLYSPNFGGCGKGVFMSRMKQWATSRNIPFTISKIDTQWLSSEYGHSLLGFISEIRKDEIHNEYFITNLNDILENDMYVSRKKFHKDLIVKSNATLVAGSNVVPTDMNNRRYAIAEYSIRDISAAGVANCPLTDNEKDLLEIDKYDDAEYWNKWFDQAFMSCPFDKAIKFANEKNEKQISQTYFDFLEEISSTPFNMMQGTIQQLTQMLYNHRLENNRNEDKFPKLRAYVRNNIMKLWKDKLLEPDNKKGRYSEPQKWVWTFSKLTDLFTQLSSQEDFNFQSDSPIEQTREAWLMLLNENKPTTTPPKTYEYTTEDAYKFKMPVNGTYKNKDGVKMFNPPTFGVVDQEYLCAAEFTQEYIENMKDSEDIVHRKKEFMQPVCFVYESDDLPLQAQENKTKEVLTSEHKDSIFSVTFSGSKSYHTLVYIKPEDRLTVKQDYKWYWEKVGKKVFGEEYYKYLDIHCSDMVRLTRRPGAVRSDNGKKQTCEYLNRNVVGIDLTELKQEWVKYDTIRKHQNALKYAEMEARKSYYRDRSSVDPMTSLRNAVNKSHNVNGQLALEILETGQSESGSNMIGALGYLKKLMDAGWDVADLHYKLWEICHSQHPSNIRSNYEHYKK